MASSTIKNGRLYSNELRKLAKSANQRMLELEKRGFRSPAYGAVQARLAALGRPVNPAASAKTQEVLIKQGKFDPKEDAPIEVYRFSETGFFTNKNEMAHLEKLLRTFMYEQETSTLRGYKKYRQEVLNGLQRRYGYKEMGLTDNEVLNFWESMPDDEQERLYGSDETFIIYAKYLVDRRAGKIKQPVNETALTAKEIVNRINNSTSVTNALKSLGISQQGYMDFKKNLVSNLGAL